MHELNQHKIAALLPQRRAQSNKGSYGSVAAAAGSLAYRGAAALCVEGADPHAGMLCPALPHRRGRRDSGRRCRRRAPALYGKACGPAEHRNAAIPLRQLLRGGGAVSLDLRHAAPQQ